MTAVGTPPVLDSDSLNDSVREVVTPEGVPLRFGIAGAVDRVVAFIIDALIILAATVILVLVVVFGEAGTGAAGFFTAFGFLAFFALRNFYFVWFELRWRGATPGKRLVGIRVVDARGGPLATEAVFARNFMRELELFIPLNVMLAPHFLWPGAAWWLRLLASGWVFVFALMPLFNTDRRRVGDLVGGTLVVRAPSVTLLPDLARAAKGETVRASEYTFTPEQLSKYGIYELQVLEDLLRRRAVTGDRTLRTVCKKIRKKIGWTDGDVNVPRFLEDFYAAQRAALEKDMLFGQRREHKGDRPDGPQRGT